ncbi:MAG TPA: hypothetical protein VFY85_11575 [Gemmatimonadaceae bacterium]|nr:hypothetical protein [Gemmatimonadaceae bacterium]
MSWLTARLRTETTVELPTLRAEQCVACHRNDGVAMNQIPLGEFGLQWVCVETATCRQRAQLAGLWKATP